MIKLSLVFYHWDVFVADMQPKIALLSCVSLRFDDIIEHRSIIQYRHFYCAQSIKFIYVMCRWLVEWIRPSVRMLKAERNVVSWPMIIQLLNGDLFSIEQPCCNLTIEDWPMSKDQSPQLLLGPLSPQTLMAIRGIRLRLLLLLLLLLTTFSRSSFRFI